MDKVMNVISPIFWGLLLLSVLVYIHEGGHFLAARLLGLRVKEFFIGLPCKYRIQYVSKKNGTAYGATPLLLGGYTLVSGMEGGSSKYLAQVLAYLQKKGRASTKEMAEKFEASEDEILDALITLNDMASVEPYYDKEKGESENQKEYPTSWQTVERDINFLTKYDKGHDFSLPGSTKSGEAHAISVSAEEFLKQEQSKIYVHLGFCKRALVLISGILINILFGMILVVLVLTLAGTNIAKNTPEIGSVGEGSLAETTGIIAGDKIVSISGTKCDTWEEMVTLLKPKLETGKSFDIIVERDGVEHRATIKMDGPVDKMGIGASYENKKFSVGEAVLYSATYVAQTASYIAKLFIPSQMQYIVENSTSVIGISVMASKAAAQGLASFAVLAAAISLSLGFMNLLPIPPLDGGKILIEAIQKIIGHPISLKVQTIISYVGIVLFILLFVVLLRQDIIRFVLGG